LATLLIRVASLLLCLPPLLFFALTLLIKPALLFLLLPFISPALLISLPALLLLGLSFVILPLALSLIGSGLLLVVSLLSFLARPAMPVRTVFRFLSVCETTGPKTACARQSQDAEHQQYRQPTKVICFHECLLVGERS
jgi:hypothetical protein